MKLSINVEVTDKTAVYDFISLKQGLKQRYAMRYIFKNSVYDFIPLKQGLKLIKIDYIQIIFKFMTLFL